MANSLDNLTPQILADILSVLRENSVMPRLVNNQYGTNAASQGSKIEINDMDDLTVYPVTPGDAPASGVKSDISSIKREVELNQFEAVTFDLTDKEIQEIQNGTRPRALEKAVAAMATRIDTQILSLYKYVSNFTGTAGTTPFASNTAVAQNASRILTTNKAAKQERRLVLDEFAYANALGLDVLQRLDASGSSEALRDAMVSRAVGFDWAEDINVNTHTVGMSGTYQVDAAGAINDTFVVLDNGAGALPTTPNVGDVFSIAGSTQAYAITSVSEGATETTVGIEPRLDQVIADGDVVTIEITADHVANLAFHRDAFAFASRPMADIDTPGSIIQTLNDEVSGLSMRYEIQRLWKKTVFSIDMLYGFAAIRPQLACRALG